MRELKDAGLRWSHVAVAARGANHYTDTPIVVNAGALQIAIVIQGALEVFWFYLLMSVIG